MKVLILQGLPGSGKSTYAKELTSKGWKRINRDLLREMLDNNYYTKKNEKLIRLIRDNILEICLINDFDVVIDDTNFEQKQIDRIKSVAGCLGCEVEVLFIDTPLKVCIERDEARERTVGKDVINQMYNKYVKHIKER